MTPRVGALTGLRFVAALFVLLAHAYPALQFQANYAIVYAIHGLAGTGMVLFFVLSGYVMSANYSDQFRPGNWRRAVWNFAVARIARLYPLYLAVMALCLLLAYDVQTIDWPSLLFFVPMAQAWIPTWGGHPLIFALPGFEHSWSLSVELALYLVFPLAVLVGRSTRSSLAFFVVILAVLAGGVAANVQLASMCSAWDPISIDTLGPDRCGWLIYRSPITHFFEFFAGMGVASASRHFAAREPTRVEGWGALACAVVALVAAIVATHLRTVSVIENDVWLQAVSQSVLLISLPVLIWWVVRHGSFARRGLEARFMVWGGEISYSLYLLHPLIIAAFIKPPRPGISGLDLLYWSTLMAGIITVCVVASWGSYMAVEVSGRRVLRRLMR